MREKKDIRIFFALWPDEAVRGRLHKIIESIELKGPSRRVPRFNLHLTLHFIGNIYSRELACLERQAHKVRAQPFELVVDTQGHFSKPRVAWLGCSEVPQPLQDLHRSLARRLDPCGYRPETRDYNPHMTIARKVDAAPAATGFEPVTWRIDKFVLIESRAIDNGVKYEVIETYPLV